MGLFNFENKYINQLAKDLIFSQGDDDGIEYRDKLVEKGRRGAEILLRVLNQEKNASNINWYSVLTTLDCMQSESDEIEEKPMN